MRYRIQIEELLSNTLVVVTEIQAYGGRSTHTTRLWTLQGDFSHGGIIELLGELQRVMGEETG